MREVTVYSLVAKKVMVYNSQDTVELIRFMQQVSPVMGSRFEYVDKEECKYHKINLPIKRYCTRGSKDVYFAFEPEALDLLNLSEREVKAQLCAKQIDINLLNDKLLEIKNMSFWQTIKFAFNKLRSNQ